MDVLSGTLTVSRVSGLIALGNSVVLFTVPLLLAILLIYHYDRTRSAASWSVLARQIHSSAWPSVLRTDSVACQNVHWSITAVAYLNVGLALLGVVSGVITPLGLGEEMRLSTVRDARFVYAPDFSSFGNGTMSRPSMPLSRDCQWNNTQCPGAVVDGVVFPVNMTAEIDLNITATTRIPQNITDMFRSATEGSTVASPWEVQYRYWMPFRSKSFDDNQPYAKGRFKHIDMLISEEKFILAEGIIADTINGGIGYRNHTVPQGLAYGGEWEEDILWIEPSIACAGTNLSLESVLAEPSRDSLEYESLKLIDRGGFEHLPMTSPFDDWPNVTTFGPEDLWERVNRTAWLSNILSSIALNLTDMQQWRYGLNISSGEKFNISRSTSSLGITPELGLSAASLGAGWLTSASRGYFLSNGSLIGGSGDNSSILQPEEDYPDILAIAMFGELNGQCRGYYGEVSDYLYAVCGYLFGAGIRTDGGQPLMEEIGSRWEQPMYTCTGAVKASVKAVTFSINGSSALEDTTVQRIRDKEYNRKEEQPLWAMEDWRYPGNEGATPAPLWGIVDSAFDERPGYNFTRSPHFWLPTTNPLRNDITDPVDMLASASAPYAALHALLGGTEAIGSDIMGSFPKYGGGHSFSLISRWRELSSTAGGSEKILRLVWTDIMASATVGTSLQETSARHSTSTDKQRAVDAYSRRLTYDVRYAIPAILLLMMWACLLLAGFIAGLVSRRPFRRLRTLLNDTSVGRHAAIAVDPASKDLARASTDRWLDAAGHIPLKLGDENHQVDSHPYRSQVEPGARDKGPETPFIRPLMRNDSLEGGSDDRTSHARESGRLEEESSDQS